MYYISKSCMKVHFSKNCSALQTFTREVFRQKPLICTVKVTVL